jgi:hypothetical protein
MNGLMHCSKIASLFDHLVGAGEQRRRHFEAQRLRGLEIDHQFILGRCLHRQLIVLGMVGGRGTSASNFLVAEEDARSPVAETVELVKPLHGQWPSSDEPRVSR